MSQINRPFRGFSGTFARPELPLTHPEIPLEPPSDVTSWHPADGTPVAVSKDRQTSHTPPYTPATHDSTAASSPSQSQSPPRPEPAKRRPSHRIIRSVSNIFHSSKAHHKPRDGLGFSKKKDACEAPTPCKNSSDVHILHGEKPFTDQEKLNITVELETLYMQMYTKAERRGFFRDAKRREAEAAARDAAYLCGPCENVDELNHPDAKLKAEVSYGEDGAPTVRLTDLVAEDAKTMEAAQALASLEIAEEEDDFYPENHPNAFLKPVISKSATWGSSSTDPASSVFTAEYSRASSQSSYGSTSASAPRDPKDEGKPVKPSMNTDGRRFHNECYKLRKAGMGGLI